jgi:hypothetical protein
VALLSGLVIILLGLSVTRGAQRKWILFFLVAGCISWLQSALTLHAGNVVHHVVLFWIPWYCALSLSAAALLTSPVRYLRAAALIIVCLFCVRGVLVLGASYGELIAHPGNPRWTNGDSALAARLLKAGVRRIIVADWGMMNVIRTRLGDGISANNQGVALNYGAFDQDAFDGCIANDCVVVGRASGRSVFSAAPATLDEAFSKIGFSPVAKTLVYDTHGIPAFEFFHVNTRPGQTISHERFSKPTISANPATLENAGGNGQVQLIWRVPMNVDIEVRRDAPNRGLVATGIGPGSAIATSVRKETEFFVQDVTGGKPLTPNNTLARVKVRVVP